MQYKIGLIGKDNQSMSKKWMTYTINNQLVDNLDHQVYLLELAVVKTKTINIHCSHIDMLLSWDIFQHSTIQYTVGWKEITLLMYLYLALYTIKNIQNQQHCNVAYYIWDVRQISNMILILC